MDPCLASVGFLPWVPLAQKWRQFVEGDGRKGRTGPGLGYKADRTYLGKERGGLWETWDPSLGYEVPPYLQYHPPHVVP